MPVSLNQPDASPPMYVRNKGGRPALAESDYRFNEIKLFLNDKEFEAFKLRADSAGLNTSAKNRARFIRDLILNQPVNAVPSINRRLIPEMNRIGVNLNQLLKRGNLSATAELAVCQMQKELSVITSEILGLNKGFGND